MSRPGSSGFVLMVVTPVVLYLALGLGGADASCGALAGVVGDPLTVLSGLLFIATRVWCVVCVPPLLAVYALWGFWRSRPLRAAPTSTSLAALGSQGGRGDTAGGDTRAL